MWDAFGETIGVYGLDGARQAQLTLSYLGGDVDPMWMPNGTSLRVADMEVPLDGGAARYVRPRDWATCSPRSEDICSPDGSHVADVIDGSLTVGRSDGSGSRTLLTELERGTGLSVIGFSPQGDRILYYTGDREGDGSGLWSIAVDGSHPRLLVAGASEGEWRSR